MGKIRDSFDNISNADNRLDRSTEKKNKFVGGTSFFKTPKVLYDSGWVARSGSLPAGVGNFIIDSNETAPVEYIINSSTGYIPIPEHILPFVESCLMYKSPTNENISSVGITENNKAYSKANVVKIGGATKYYGGDLGYVVYSSQEVAPIGEIPLTSVRKIWKFDIVFTDINTARKFKIVNVERISDDAPSIGVNHVGLDIPAPWNPPEIASPGFGKAGNSGYYGRYFGSSIYEFTGGTWVKVSGTFSVFADFGASETVATYDISPVFPGGGSVSGRCDNTVSFESVFSNTYQYYIDSNRLIPLMFDFNVDNYYVLELPTIQVIDPDDFDYVMGLMPSTIILEQEISEVDRNNEYVTSEFKNINYMKPESQLIQPKGHIPQFSIATEGIVFLQKAANKKYTKTINKNQKNTYSLISDPGEFTHYVKYVEEIEELPDEEYTYFKPTADDIFIRYIVTVKNPIYWEEMRKYIK